MFTYPVSRKIFINLVATLDHIHEAEKPVGWGQGRRRVKMRLLSLLSYISID